MSKTRRANVSPVAKFIPQLVALAAQKCAERPALRAELAAVLGLDPQQAMGMLLSGSRAPNSERALQLYLWLARSEGEVPWLPSKKRTRDVRTTREKNAGLHNKIRALRIEQSK